MDYLTEFQNQFKEAANEILEQSTKDLKASYDSAMMGFAKANQVYNEGLVAIENQKGMKSVINQEDVDDEKLYRHFGNVRK